MTPADALSDPSEAAPLFVAPGQRHAGAVDFVDLAAGLRGWVIDCESPGCPVELQVRCAGSVLARSVAILDRPDIDAVLGRLTQGGFLLGWSRFDTRTLGRIAAADPTAGVHVAIAASGQRLQAVCEVPPAARLLALIKASPVGDLSPDFRELQDYIEIENSALFDAEYYQRIHGDGIVVGMPPLLHYIRHGEAQGFRPNFYFDPLAYSRDAGRQGPGGSLLHFIRSGSANGIAPSFHFDGVWYEAHYGIARGAKALAHYLAHRRTNAPNRWFDVQQAVSAAAPDRPADPYEWFATHGVPAGAFPSAQMKDEAARGALSAEAARYLAKLRGRTSAPEREPGLPRRPGAVAGAPLPAPASWHPDAAALAPWPSVAAGWDATEAHLASLASRDLAQVIASAEGAMAREAPTRIAAALTLAIARGLAGDREGAARAAAVLLAAPSLDVAALHDDVLPRLTRASHAWFEAGADDASVEVYRLLHQRGHHDYLAVVRLLEVSVRRNDTASAAPYAQELERSFGARIDAWGAAALSRYFQARGETQRAIALLSAVPRMPGNSVAAEALILHRLVECDDLEAAAARLKAAPEADSPELFGASLRIAVRRGDFASLATLFGSPRLSGVPDWLLGESMFVLSNPSHMPLAEAHPLLVRLDAAIEERVARNPRLLHARMHYLLQAKRWEELGLLFEAIEGTDLAAERETLLRRLEYYCYADNSQGAERIYRDHFQNTALNQWEGLTILRLLSELKRWDEAARVLLNHVARGFGFSGGQHVAMRIVRKAGVHEALLELHDGRAGASNPGDIGDFLNLVREDLTILERARSFATHTDSNKYRSNWIINADPMKIEETEQRFLFLCVNQKYFLSLLTFLCSFLAQSPQVMCRIFIFLDKDVPRHWYGTIAMVSARFGRSIDLVPEADFVPNDVDHREDYGFFAGGGSLSRAAYFRLYAARYLLNRFDALRALYMDTDTICRGDLTSLFEFDIDGALVGAAIEDYSRDVIDAASRHGLQPEEYFNSGVLLFPMDNPALRPALDASIRLAEQEQERLMFQDQCALNIAFRGQVRPLPRRYNFFLRPNRERNGFIEDGLVLHFVDKPKPWDIVFDRTYREEWRVWALFLGSILPQNIYIDIFAAANRD